LRTCYCCDSIKGCQIRFAFQMFLTRYKEAFDQTKLSPLGDGIAKACLQFTDFEKQRAKQGRNKNKPKRRCQ